jgi:hypothetical protein
MIGLNGGLLGRARIPSPTGAVGTWTLNEQSISQRQQIWPVAGAGIQYRYWRWFGFTTNNALLEVSEWRLMNGASVISGGTWTFVGANFTNTGTAALTDGVLGTRAFQLQTPLSNSAIIYDHGSIVSADGWQYATYTSFSERIVTAVSVEGSNNGSTYFPVASFSGLTRYSSSNSVLSPIYLFSP